ncbi:DUF4262 domain-containing protein [Allokutzneria oryzae]|uniref:DUF4262 domain-containing protein n=1 Tax=Allokutzneria oryzae TaxID=1378989 RepID=A0ABV6A5R9_9PSEU
MCWDCDNPDGDYLAHLRGIIDSHGWAVQGVEGDGVHPPWAYTVGLTPRGKPELVVTGMPFQGAAGLLNVIAPETVQAGERIELGEALLIEVVELAVPSAHLHVAVGLYGPEVRALQLVHADLHGRWPWERGYRGVRGGQPVLGVRDQ